MGDVAERLRQVQRRIADACRRAGRAPEEVQLVCVSKTVDAARIGAAYDAGARLFGENYGQDLRDKAQELAGLDGLTWHFIGPLQRNKVRYVVGTAALIHSVHTPELLQAVDDRAGRGGLVQDYLVQLNLAGEPTKSGIAAEDLRTMLELARRLRHSRCVGLMTMPPFFDDPERARAYFARLRALRDRASTVSETGGREVDLRHLSMGMTGDFEVAIEEGATLVRVGTAVFGERGQARGAEKAR